MFRTQVGEQLKSIKPIEKNQEFDYNERQKESFWTSTMKINYKAPGLSFYGQIYFQLTVSTVQVSA